MDRTYDYVFSHGAAIESDHDNIMQTYGRFPLEADHGKGSMLYTTDGREFVDFTSGIGVNSLGYADEKWIAAVSNQISRFSHISNYYYSPTTSELAKRLCRLSGMCRVFFCNSGAEANEGAIKLARKYSSDKYSPDRHVIISLISSFHGRTITTLSATGQDVFHRNFTPLTDGFRYIPLNDTQALDTALACKDVCAVIAEPIQGEGGVNPMSDEYAEYLRKKCTENDILLIADEVQTGIGRTGTFLCCQSLGLSPDIVTTAKGLGGGLPIGAFMCNEKCSDTLKKGDHGSTFGGNPVSAAGALSVIDRVGNPSFLEEVTRKGRDISNRVKHWDIPFISDIRGKGLMIGIAVDSEKTDKDCKYFVEKAFEKGLLVLTAGGNVIRLLPPLTINDDEITEGLKILKEVLDEN